jgi:hypothetical protein
VLSADGRDFTFRWIRLKSEQGITVQITPYTEELETEVRSFNQRLRANGVKRWSMPESHRPQFSRVDGRFPYQELFVSVHAGAVRGGYLLQHNQFALRGEETTIACGPHYNSSEGLINRAYAMVGTIQAQDALRRQPLMYALGMGRLDAPLAKLLVAMEWVAFPVPFYFRVLSTSRFFKNLTHLRDSPWKRIATDLLHYSGLGFLALQAAQTRWRPLKIRTSGTVVDSFGTWADKIWENCRSRYSLIGRRDSSSLNLFYPPEDPRFARLRVSTDTHDIGWAVALDSQMRGDRHFGNMRVGSIVDCLAAPEDAVHVLNYATQFFEQRGVDISITNQSSSAWCSALAANGYLKGPSNFILAISPQLVHRLLPLESHAEQIHMNRADGGYPALTPLFPANQ